MEAEDGENNGDTMEGTKGTRCWKSEEPPQGNTQQDGESSSHLMEPPLKEPVDTFAHNSSCEQVNLQINSSDDCSERHWMIPILEQMYQSIGDDEGGVQVCITEAIEHYQKIDHTLPKESGECHKDHKYWLLEHSVLYGPQDEASWDEVQEDVISNASLSESQHRTVTAMCQHALVNVLVSKEFASLCKLLLHKFKGIKADSIFDLKLINARMKSGEYQDSLLLFSMDMQEAFGHYSPALNFMEHLDGVASLFADVRLRHGTLVPEPVQEWRKLLGVCTVLIPLANSLSDMSRTSKEKVQCSVYNTYEGGCNEIYLQGILTVLSRWPYQPLRSVFKLVNFLTLLLEDAEIDPDDEVPKTTAYNSLTEIDKFLSFSSLDQRTVELLSDELPKAVAKFGGVSERCMNAAKSILDRFVSWSAAGMLFVFQKALVDIVEDSKGFGYGGVAPLVHGFAKVFESLQKHHFESIKGAIGIILIALKGASVRLETDSEFEILLDRVVHMATSIRVVCMKLEDKDCEKLRALLGFFVLEITVHIPPSSKFQALVCRHLLKKRAWPLIKLLSRFVPSCGLSYMGLITGSDVDKISLLVNDEHEDGYFSSLSNVKLGASLSVVWGYTSDEIAKAAEQDLIAVIDELQNNQTKRWQTFGMLEQILSSDPMLQREYEEASIDFMLSIRGGNSSPCDEHNELSSAAVLGLLTVLQALKRLVTSPRHDNDLLENKAFEALKWILEDIPPSHRVEKREIVKALMSDSSS